MSSLIKKCSILFNLLCASVIFLPKYWQSTLIYTVWRIDSNISGFKWMPYPIFFKCLCEYVCVCVWWWGGWGGGRGGRQMFIRVTTNFSLQNSQTFKATYFSKFEDKIQYIWRQNLKTKFNSLPYVIHVHSSLHGSNNKVLPFADHIFYQPKHKAILLALLSYWLFTSVKILIFHRLSSL